MPHSVSLASHCPTQSPSPPMPPPLPPWPPPPWLPSPPPPPHLPLLGAEGLQLPGAPGLSPGPAASVLNAEPPFELPEPPHATTSARTESTLARSQTISILPG